MIRTASRLIKYAISVPRIDLKPHALKKISKIDFVSPMVASTRWSD